MFVGLWYKSAVHQWVVSFSTFQKDVVISPRQEMDVPARSTLLTPTLVGPDCMVDSHEVRLGLYVGLILKTAVYP